VDINDVLQETDTHIYFLIGPGAQRLAAVNAFIATLGLQERHLERVAAVDRRVLERHQGRVLRYLAFSRHMITREWVRRYITGVDDPASRVKNLGRLALAMTLDQAMQAFLDSNHSNFLVFEDDVIASPAPGLDVPAQFADMLRLPPDLWHLQYLGFCFECFEGEGNRGRAGPGPGYGQPLYTAAVFPLCTHALLLRRAAVLVVMNTYKPFVSNKGDWALHVTACQHGLKVIRPLQPIFLQNVSAATVGQSQLGNYNDKRPFASWVRCARERKACAALAANHSKSPPATRIDDSPLAQTLTYTRGIPINLVI